VNMSREEQESGFSRKEMQYPIDEFQATDTSEGGMDSNDIHKKEEEEEVIGYVHLEWLPDESSERDWNNYPFDEQYTSDSGETSVLFFSSIYILFTYFYLLCFLILK